MRILYISSSWLHGRSFGGQLRALNIARALKRKGEVTVVVVSADAGDASARRQTEEEFPTLQPVCPEFSPNRGVIQKMRWALDPSYLNLHGCRASPQERARIVSHFAEYDIVWVLNSRTANILQQWRWPNGHLDIDDVPSTYLRGAPARGERVGARLKRIAQRFLWKRRELLFERRFSTLSVCSEPDRQYLGGSGRIHVIPNGFARPSGMPPRAPAVSPPRIGFIGLFSYAPNLEGVKWFLRECWPAIRRQVPGIRFRLAGKDTDGPIRPPDPDVDVLGWIEDPSAEIATWSAMVIPIQFGGGTRIKLADAFSRKCPVVSTAVGAFGYEVQNGVHLRLADAPSEFASACVQLAHDQVFGAKMAETAWDEFQKKWTWDAIAPKVWHAADECLRRSTAQNKAGIGR